MHAGPCRTSPAPRCSPAWLANALGYRREQRAAHARLQARLVFASRLDRPGTRLTDFQTAQLGRGDAGWTTRGALEGRTGGPDTYNSPHIRYREYDADKRAVVALRLIDADEVPTLHDLATALQAPARPLFIGRKPCLPSVPLFGGLVEAAGLLAALATLPPQPGPDPMRLDLPLSGSRPARGSPILVGRPARLAQRRACRRAGAGGAHPFRPRPRDVVIVEAGARPGARDTVGACAGLARPTADR